MNDFFRLQGLEETLFEIREKIEYLAGLTTPADIERELVHLRQDEADVLRRIDDEDTKLDLGTDADLTESEETR